MLILVSYLALIALLSVIVWAFAYAPKSALGYQPAVSIYNLIVFLLLLYLFFSAFLIIIVNGSQFVWRPDLSDPLLEIGSLVICVFAAATFLLVYKLTWSSLAVRAQRGRLTSRYEFNPSLAQLFFFVGAAVKVIVIVRMGGLDAAMIQLSSGVSHALHYATIDNVTVYLQFASKINDAAATLILMEAIRRRRARALVFAVLQYLFALGTTYIVFGKRLELLIPILAVALAINFYWKPISIRNAPFLIGTSLVLGAGTLFARTLLPLMLTDSSLNLYEVPWAHGSLLAFYFFSLEFSTYEMLTVSIAKSQEVLDHFGGYWPALYRVNIEPLLYAIPRALWPNKPVQFVDLSHGIGSEVFGSDLDVTVGGVASTLVGVGWVFGGAPGVALLMSMLGYFAARVDTFWKVTSKPNPSEMLVYAMACMVAFQVFRQGTLGWIFLTCFQTVLPFAVSAWTLNSLMLLYSSNRRGKRRSVMHVRPISGQR